MDSTLNLHDSRSQRERMLAGDLYNADDPELMQDIVRAERLLLEYNATVPVIGRFAMRF